MNEARLELISPEGLVKKLNSNVDESEGEVSLGNFVSREPRKNPFLYRLKDIVLVTRGKFPLIQIAYKGIGAVFDLESEINLGYIFI